MLFQRIFKDIGKNNPNDSASNTSLDSREIVLSPGALRQLNRMQLSASRYLAGFYSGLRPGIRRKLSVEFHEHRKYTPGDDLRFVDWKVSARHEHVFVRQGQQPKETNVYLLIDCSSSMSWGAPEKAIKQLVTAAAISYMALAHSDRLKIVPFTDNHSFPSFGPASGKGQYPEVVRYLRNIPYEGQVSLERSVNQFRQNTDKVGGLIILLSDLLGITNLNSILEVLPSPTWDVIIIQMLHPEELAPTISGDLEMVDIETQQKANYDVDQQAIQLYEKRLKNWLESLEVSCVENGAFYTLIPTNWELDKDILPQLRKINVIKPL